MGVLSKEQKILRTFMFNAFTNKKSAIPIIGSLLLIFLFQNYRNKKLKKSLIESSHKNMSLRKLEILKTKKKATLSLETLKNFRTLIKLGNPKFFSMLTLEMFLMTGTLVSRTFLSILIASVNGTLVKSIIARDLNSFVMAIVKMCIISVPASFLNSYIQYLIKSITFHMRENLTTYFQGRYVNNKRFYQVSNIDSRIRNADQRLTQDIKNFAQGFSLLYSNLTKPVIDMVLFTKSLSDKIGFPTVSLTFVWYGLSAIVLKFISPPMGMLYAFQQNYEGDYRAQHSNIKAYSQEIGFLNGGKWEVNMLDEKFKQLYEHNEQILLKRLFLGVFDNLLTKFGATMVGYFVLAKPSMNFFSSNKAKVGLIDLTGDYIRNGSLMVNLAKAMGRIVVTYKDAQTILGYTVLLTETKKVLDDLDQGKYLKAQTGASKSGEMQIMSTENKGQIIESDKNDIVFKDVQVVTPNGFILIESLNFCLKQGENLIISGPNGCGKSSLFRVLGNLWPLKYGSIERPPMNKLFYLPQRPYISEGRLVDQILYPVVEDSEIDYPKIIKWMTFVQLENLLEKDKEIECLSEVKDWKQVLSEGEKQRIAMARLLYHKPLFAILDECSSRVSADMERNFYTKAKEEKISLFTIAHRVTLFKYHDKQLKIEPNGVWEIVEINEEVLEKIENTYVGDNSQSSNQ